MSPTAVFDPRSNSLNAVRLGLALLVVVSHSWALGGAGPEPELGGMNLGTWAVFGFFGISGYLITRSRVSGQPVRQFYRARILRLFPGFLVSLVVVAFVFAPFSLLLHPGGTFTVLDQAGFVVRNLLLYPPFIGQYDIGSTLTETPFSGVWNGPLWTLFWEAACYVLVGVAASLWPRRILGRIMIAILIVASLTGLTAASLEAVPALVDRSLPMIAAFAGGAVLYLHDERFRSKWGIPAALLLLVVSVFSNTATTVAALPLTYLLFVLSAVIPLRKVGTRFDISYGVYIYGWPVQQSIALMVGATLPVWVFITVSIAGTLPLAFLSCLFVEQRALAFKQAHKASSLPVAAANSSTGRKEGPTFTV